MSEGPPRGKVRAWLEALPVDQIPFWSAVWVLPLFAVGLLATVALPAWAAAAVVVALAVGAVVICLVVLARWGNADADHLAEERHWFD